MATVDMEGNVTIHTSGTCEITVATTDGSNLTAKCMISGTSDIDAIFGNDALFDVYDMNGNLLKHMCTHGELKQLTPGIYILRSGNTLVKTVVR